MEEEALRRLRRRCETFVPPKRQREESATTTSKRRMVSSSSDGFVEGFAAGVAEERSRLLAIGEATLSEALQSLEERYVVELSRFEDALRSSTTTTVWGY